MGTMLAVPASILSDFLLKGFVVPPVALLGMAGIVLAFATLMLAPSIDAMLLRAQRRALRSCHPATPRVKLPAQDHAKGGKTGAVTLL